MALDWAPLLLADPSSALRWLVLREMLSRPDDDLELRELAGRRETDPLVTDLLALQAPDGSWTSAPASKLQATSQALMRLGYLGFDPNHRAVQRGAEYLFSQQQEDGAWPLAGAWKVPDGMRPAEAREGYSMVPLQTAIPLRSLAACGYVGDPRAERAYDWLLAQRLDDGAWPTGIAAGNYGYVGGYRRLAHSRWGCRSNTTGALICLAHHPEHQRGPEARRALDLLLGRETREKHALGFEVARLIGVEPARGFLTYFARFDLALVLDLCWRVGATPEDERVADAMAFVREQQGLYGLWEYTARPQASRWVTFDVLRSLSRLEASEGEWLGFEPRTSFQAYPRWPKRY